MLAVGLAILALLAGCSMAEEPEAPLRIVMDLAVGSHTVGTDWCNSFAARARVSLKESGLEVETEILPRNGPERTTALERIRTEIMAGEGPDVFICGCSDPKQWVDPLFTFPGKSAENGLFLPLDEYLENTRYMNWDEMIPKVMAGGKTEDGQVILPMTYSVHLSIFDEDDLDGDYAAARTWEEALSLAEQDPVWKSVCLENYLTYWGDALGKIVDYKTDTLTFSQEDLLKLTLELRELCTAAEEWQQASLGYGHESDVVSEVFGAPKHASLRFGMPYGSNLNKISYRYNGVPTVSDYAVDLISSEERARMIPLYNQQGGVTAVVTSWAAVNHNTKHPQEAFQVLDLLLSEHTMRGELYENLTGMPVGEQMGSGLAKIPMGDFKGVTWGMSAGNFAEYQRVLRQINAVRFQDSLDNQLFQLMLRTVYAADEETVTQKVSAAYAETEKMLGES